MPAQRDPLRRRTVVRQGEPLFADKDMRQHEEAHNTSLAAYFAKRMDTRVKPAYDVGCVALPFATTSSPGLFR